MMNPGRALGVLLLVEMAASALSNFGLQAPLFGPPGFLVNAAPHATQLAAAALLTLAMGWLPLGVAAAAGPFFRRRGESTAIGFISLAVVCCGLKALESIQLLSMLSLSQTFVSATAPNAELFQALRTVVSASRNWTHFVQLLSAGAMSAALYAGIFRFSLAPRPLAALGLLSSLLQMTVVARPLFGLEIVFPLLAPLGLSHLALASWLLVKGFREASGAAQHAGQRWAAQSQAQP